MQKDDPETARPEEAGTDTPTGLPYPVLTLVPGGIADPDSFLRESVPPLLVRVQFSVYDPGAATYRSWPYVRFGLTFPSAELAAQFRDDMDAWVRGWVGEHGGKA